MHLRCRDTPPQAALPLKERSGNVRGAFECRRDLSGERIPEGGSGGGTLLAEGTPEHVATVEASHTGRFLAPLLT